MNNVDKYLKKANLTRAGLAIRLGRNIRIVDDLIDEAIKPDNYLVNSICVILDTPKEKIFPDLFLVVKTLKKKSKKISNKISKNRRKRIEKIENYIKQNGPTRLEILAVNLGRGVQLIRNDIRCRENIGLGISDGIVYYGDEPVFKKDYILSPENVENVDYTSYQIDTGEFKKQIEFKKRYRGIFTELADFLGITRSIPSRWEKDLKIFPIHNEKICRFFNCKISMIGFPINGNPSSIKSNINYDNYRIKAESFKQLMENRSVKILALKLNISTPTPPRWKSGKEKIPTKYNKIICEYLCIDDITTIAEKIVVKKSRSGNRKVKNKKNITAIPIKKAEFDQGIEQNKKNIDGPELRGIRESKGYSQKDVAEKLNLKQPWISAIELNNRQIDKKRYHDFLLGLENNPDPIVPVKKIDRGGVIEMLKAKCPVKDIASRFNISTPPIYRIARKAGIKTSGHTHGQNHLTCQDIKSSVDFNTHQSCITPVQEPKISELELLAFIGRMALADPDFQKKIKNNAEIGDFFKVNELKKKIEEQAAEIQLLNQKIEDLTEDDFGIIQPGFDF